MKKVMIGLILFGVCACQSMSQTDLKPQQVPPQDEPGDFTPVQEKQGIKYQSKLSSFASRYFLYILLTNDTAETVTVQSDKVLVKASCSKDAILKGVTVYSGSKPPSGVRFIDAKSKDFGKSYELPSHKQLSINYTFQMPVGRCGITESEFAGVTSANAPLSFTSKFESDGSFF